MNWHCHLLWCSSVTTFCAPHLAKMVRCEVDNYDEWCGSAMLVYLCKNLGGKRRESRRGHVKSLQYVLSTFEIFLVLLVSMVDWLLCFFVSELPACIGYIPALVSALAPPNAYVVKAQPCFPPRPSSPRNIVPTSSCNEHISDACGTSNWHSERCLKLTFQAWPQIDILSMTSNWYSEHCLKLTFWAQPQIDIPNFSATANWHS